MTFSCRFAWKLPSFIDWMMETNKFWAYWCHSNWKFIKILNYLWLDQSNLISLVQNLDANGTNWCNCCWNCLVSLTGWWKQTSFGHIDANLIEISSKTWLICDSINQIPSVWLKISMEMGQIGAIVAKICLVSLIES